MTRRGHPCVHRERRGYSSEQAVGGLSKHHVGSKQIRSLYRQQIKALSSLDSSGEAFLPYLGEALLRYESEKGDLRTAARWIQHGMARRYELVAKFCDEKAASALDGMGNAAARARPRLIYAECWHALRLIDIEDLHLAVRLGGHSRRGAFDVALQ